MCFHYGGQIVTALIKNRAPQSKPAPTLPLVQEAPPEVEEIGLSGSSSGSGGSSLEGNISQEIPQGDEEGPSSIKAGCVPCAIGHISTCSGGLAEAMRFARKEGMASNQVIDRIGHCLEELNIMEREDLSPQKISSLPQWEKDLALEALNVSREMRHKLEDMGKSSTVNDLEATAAWAQESRQEIVRGWFKQKLAGMSAQEKSELTKKAIAKLEKE